MTKGKSGKAKVFVMMDHSQYHIHDCSTTINIENVNW